MGYLETDTERRLRDLNGVLDLAVLLAVDVIREHEDHGLSQLEWQRRLIGEAAKKLGSAGLFPGRFSLFSDEELTTMWHALISVEPHSDLTHEVVFEATRRSLPWTQPAEPEGE